MMDAEYMVQLLVFKNQEVKLFETKIMGIYNSLSWAECVQQCARIQKHVKGYPLPPASCLLPPASCLLPPAW